ncbi:uncharacterized protein VTP21DRAFT_3195 [Calcarisporiella thermophila]|uniref:uncharacterized protein n=1 Tax=Calcarisporiella thermophila TaxID=911321 RepID=UPI0037432C7A
MKIRSLIAILGVVSLALAKGSKDDTYTYITDIGLKACDSVYCELPQPWHRVPMDLNKGAKGKYIYLHYRKDARGKPITNIIQLKDDEPAPAGYKKLELNVNEGSKAPKRYLAFTTSLSAGDPIQNLLVKFGGDAIAIDGYRKFNFNLNDGLGEVVNLFYQPKTKEVPISDITVEVCDDKACEKEGWTKSNHDLNADVSDKYIYIFYKRLGHGAAITDLKASTKTDMPGYIRIETNLNEGTEGKPVYLFYKKSKKGTPVYDITVLSGQDLVDPYGYTKVDQDLNVESSGYPVYLYYRHKQKELPQTPKLKFHRDGTFKILQLADLHMTSNRGGCIDIPKTPEWKNCTNLKTFAFAERMIAAEKPDMIVFTGDNVMGSPDPRASVLKYASIAFKHKIPWAFVHGNHDDEASLSRLELTQTALSLPYSLGQNGPYSLFGSGNYYTQILGKGDKPSFTLYFVDSGAYNLDTSIKGYDYIKEDQIDWFRETSKAIGGKKEKKPNAVAFWHIPTNEYKKVSEVPDKRVGDIGEKVSSPVTETPFIDALHEAGDVKMTVVGHDHVNDYCFPHKSMQLCYGGGAGYGTYGATNKGWDRRARIIQLTDFGKHIKTWKRKDNADLSVLNPQLIV